jgi:hypothetical protein
MTAAERILELYKTTPYGHGYTTRYIAGTLVLPIASVRRVFNELNDAGKLMRNPHAPQLIIPVVRQHPDYQLYGD